MVNMTRYETVLGVFVFGLIQMVFVIAQSTANCPTESCFRYPPLCENMACTFIYKWIENGDSVHFFMAGKINRFENRYLAIGLSKDAKMGDDNVVVCKTTGDIHHYYNPHDHNPSVLLDPKTPSIGIINGKVEQNGDWLICRFDRQKTNDNVRNYFDLTKSFFVLAAFGNLDRSPQQGLTWHERKIASDSIFGFVVSGGGGRQSSTLPKQPKQRDSQISNLITQCRTSLSLSCFLSPTDCRGDDCVFAFLWNDKITSTDFIMAGKINRFDNRYLAMGFSNDRSMGDDNVVVCKTTGDIHHYYNPHDHNPSVLLDPNTPSIGITNAKVEQNDNWLICRFNRQKSMEDVRHYFDLNNDNFFMLASFGNLDQTARRLSWHEKRVASNVAFDFNGKSQILPQAQLSQNTTERRNKSIQIADLLTDCEDGANCFLHPENCKSTDCKFIYTWTDDSDNSTHFNIAGNLDTLQDKYIAIGFSKDRKMGNSNVVSCKTNGDVQHYFNPHKHEPSVLLDASRPSVGLTNTRVELNDSWLTCHFDRQKAFNDTPNYFDLNESYFVLAAYGNIDSTSADLKMHRHKTASKDEKNFVKT